MTAPLIVGAGLAGLLAGNMLRHLHPEIVERSTTLPNNHAAVLRFRSPVVGDVTGIPFRKVSVIKAVLPWLNPIAEALAYSRKNTGVMRSDRSIISAVNPVVEDRWIAPADLVSRMAERLFRQPAFDADFHHTDGSRPVISTIPMPKLMEILEWPDPPKFEYRRGNVIRARIRNCDAFVSMYVPNPAANASRISITGDEMIVEGGAEVMSAIDAARLLGIEPDALFEVRTYEQRYAKILPIEDRTRKHFMHWATDTFGIYSLGRYATWRPGLLLDDLVKDVFLIEKWIGDRYEVARHR